MIAWLAAWLLAMQDFASLAGTYQTHQMEVGAMLELNEDGTFRYMLDYGAVSEAAQGHWTATEGAIHLESDPLAADLMAQIERSDASFGNEKLAIDDGVLVLQRHETIFTFYRDEP